MMKDFIDWILSKYAQREHVRNKMLARWNRMMGCETKPHNQLVSSPGKSQNVEVNVKMLRLYISLSFEKIFLHILISSFHNLTFFTNLNQEETSSHYSENKVPKFYSSFEF